MKKYGVVIIFLLSFCSCTYNLVENTIFLPDEEDSNLPAYTEWGYNSFGAKYERQYFLATNDIVPCKIIYRNGILNFSLRGRLGFNYHLTNYNSEEMMMTFSFPFSLINEYKNLMILNQKEIDLTDVSCGVQMTIGSQTEALKLYSGSLVFNKTRLLRINEKEDRIILSGRFEAKFLRNDMPETLSNGRFDLGINEVFDLSE